MGRRRCRALPTQHDPSSAEKILPSPSDYSNPKPHHNTPLKKKKDRYQSLGKNVKPKKSVTPNKKQSAKEKRENCQKRRSCNNKLPTNPKPPNPKVAFPIVGISPTAKKQAPFGSETSKSADHLDYDSVFPEKSDPIHGFGTQNLKREK